MARYNKRPAVERFWEKVDRSGGEDACWPWTGYIKPNGYGTFFPARLQCTYAHRYAWEIANGRTPSECVLHRCDNRACCNPRHLWEGSYMENTHDMIRKGRRRVGQQRHRHSPSVEAEVMRRIALGEQRKEIAASLGISRRAPLRIARRVQAYRNGEITSKPRVRASVRPRPTVRRVTVSEEMRDQLSQYDL